MMPNTDTILWIALFRGIGDAVLLYPALKKCASVFPSARIDIVVRTPTVTDVLRAYGFQGRILHMPGHPLCRILWIARLGARSYSLVFDASSVEHIHLSRYIAYVAARHASIGYHYGSSSWLYTVKLDTSPLATRHMKDIYAHLMSPFAPVEPLPLEPPSPSPDILHTLPLPPRRGKRIIMHPGGRDNLDRFEKRWPIAKYKQLIERCISYGPCDILLIGSAAEHAWIGEGTKDVGGTAVVNLAGATSIAQVLELIRSADVFIGNNSGPLHIAASCRIPIVTFAGGVPLYRWGVEQHEYCIVLGIDKRCPACTEYECDRRGVPCLEAISVDEAFEAVKRMLDRTSNEEGPR